MLMKKTGVDNQRHFFFVNKWFNIQRSQKLFKQIHFFYLYFHTKALKIMTNRCERVYIKIHTKIKTVFKR